MDRHGRARAEGSERPVRSPVPLFRCADAREPFGRSCVMGEDGQRCPSQVARKMAGGQRGIAGFTGFEDALVFLGGNRGRRNPLDVEPAVAIGMIVELADGAHQAIAGVREQRGEIRDRRSATGAGRGRLALPCGEGSREAHRCRAS